MDRIKQLIILLVILFIPGYLFASTFHIPWDITDGGGGTTKSDRYKIKDSIGQSATGFSGSEKQEVYSGATRNYPYTLIIITSPGAGESITSKIEILGSANSNYFRGYQLSYGASDNPKDWKILTTSSTPVMDSILGEWDTKGLAGKYSLRLHIDDTTHQGKERVIQVLISNTTTQKLTLPKEEWRMVSFPLVAMERKPSDFFSNLPDIKVYYWEEKAEINEYLKYRLPEEILPGRAYWVKIPESGEYTFSGDLVDQTVDFSLPLNAGWNQIATPFIFDINWNDTKLKYKDEVYDLKTAIETKYISSYIYWYEDGGYIYTSAPEGILEPVKGFWIYSYVDSELILSPLLSSPSASKAKTKNKPYLPKTTTEEGWCVQISVSCDQYQDLYNFIGVVSSDSPYNNALEPPVIGNYVSLYFLDNQDQRLKYTNAITKLDTEQRDTDTKSYNMTVETNLFNTDTTLHWKEVKRLPEDIDLILYDKLSGKIIDMKGSTSYKFNSGPRGRREFEVRAGKFQQGGLNLEKISNFPNPTSGNTTFVYKYGGIPVKVDIEIYNLAGRLIKRFEDSTINGQFNTSLSFLANGVYIYRIVITDSQGNKVSKINKLAVVK